MKGIDAITPLWRPTIAPKHGLQRFRSVFFLWVCHVVINQDRELRVVGHQPFRSSCKVSGLPICGRSSVMVASPVTKASVMCVFCVRLRVAAAVFANPDTAPPTRPPFSEDFFQRRDPDLPPRLSLSTVAHPRRSASPLDIAYACRYIWIFHLASSPTSSFHPVALKAEELNLFLRKPRSDRFSSKFERGGTLKMNCRCPVDQGFTRGEREINATQ